MGEINNLREAMDAQKQRLREGGLSAAEAEKRARASALRVDRKIRDGDLSIPKDNK